MEAREGGRLNLCFRLDAWTQAGACPDGIGACVFMIARRGRKYSKHLELAKISVYCSEEGQREFGKFNEGAINQRFLYDAYIERFNKATGRMIV